MRSFSLRISVLVAAAAAMAFGQVGNGTITGTVTDPAGAVVPGASVQAKNAETGIGFPAVSTNTGNYTIADLPVGTYTLTVTASGFKTYTHTNLAVAATQILRQDVPLEVGATNESVTVTAEATLLKTESGELSDNVSIDQLDELPLLGIGTANSGTSGVRNPYNTLQTLPGVSSYATSAQFTLNGLGGTMTETMRVEGQDATSRLFGTYDYTQMGQVSADAVQEIAFQTSNYAAEYGQAGSAVINLTMKSGTNRWHGLGQEYFVNEDLNAGDPFTQNTLAGGGKVRPRNRRNDFGGNFGGPVWIPKIYNGKNKTFFFFNYEEYLEKTGYAFTDTVPTAAYLQGDFSAISPNGTCSACLALGVPQGAITKDPLGNNVYANEIYNPTTRSTINGLGYALPFQGNRIPLSMFDPVSKNILALLPAATNGNFTGNYSASIAGNRYSAIPSIKIDHNLSDKDKLSFFWSRINTESQISSPFGGADGLPLEIGAYRGTFIPTYTTRVNYDRTLTPTLLFHFGAGFYHTKFFDHAPFLNFDPTSIGLSGFLIHRQFPQITGMCQQPLFFGQTGCQGALGGMQNLGESIQTLNFEEKPTFNSNLTWIRGSHTYKAGAEVLLEQVYNGSFSTVTLATGTQATSEPFTPTNGLNGQTMGFGFASFLLGDYGYVNPLTQAVSSTTQNPQENYRQGNQEWGLYIQDSWKVTRKMTVDYGLRWDYATQYKEQYNRLGQFSPTAPNPSAGGAPGGTIFANTCNCPFYRSPYPFALGPRLGVAYQIDPKTVFRAGWGVNYQFVAASSGAIVATSGVYPLAGINPFVNDQTPGFLQAPVWPNTDPGRYPVPGTTPGSSGTPTAPDRNAERPPRVNQWSIGIQRQITNSFLIEASYVANRGVWEQSAGSFGGGPYGYLSQISAATYAKFGLYPYAGTGPSGYNYSIPGNSCRPGNDCDRALLNLPLTSPVVQAKLASVGLANFSPYPGFSSIRGVTLQSALYPYAQFGNLAVSNSPTGDSRYNSLQVQATKRLSHGLQAGGAFTWAKGFARANPQDFFNTASSLWDLQNIPPLALTFNVTYTVPKFAALPRYANLAARDWQVGFFAQYQSGTFLTPPASNVNAEFLSSEEVRVPGVPLYNVDINNIHSYNPYYQQVLNPNAWTPCPVNSACTATGTLYSDFRGPRTPRENANIGRHFRIKEKYDFYVRAEFVNIFNRTILPNPTTSVGPQVPLSHNSLGILNNGFGVINAYQIPGAYPAPTAGATALLGRTGTIIARFQF